MAGHHGLARRTRESNDMTMRWLKCIAPATATACLLVCLNGATAAPGTALSTCRVASPGVAQYADVLLAEHPSGFEVVGAARLRGSKLVTVLHAVTAACRRITSFGKKGTTIVALKASAYGRIDTIAAAPDGRILLGGGDGKRAVIGRLLADGALDPSFGVSGWVRVRVPKHPVDDDPALSAATVTSIAFGPAGEIFVGGDDGGPHCCVKDFVAALSVRGGPVRSFGGGDAVLLPYLASEGSYTTNLLAGARGDVYALTARFYTGCGGPTVFHIRPDGSLDGPFDRTVARTIKAVTPPRLTFVPAAIVRAEHRAFVVVGEAGSVCINDPGSTDVALGVGILRSGLVDTSFGRRGRAVISGLKGGGFNSGATTMPGGQYVLVGTPTGGRTAPPQLRVTVLSSSGTLDRAFGRSGSLTVGVPALGSAVPPSIAVAPAPNDVAVVAVGSTKAIELIRLPI
jgi:hypothetical protein